jgi:two-component system KDP operon response regulator KdpE
MKGCDVLLIEDDPAVRSLMRQSLEELHLKLHEESDGAIGEARARDYLPSVILLDLGLPGKSGIEILRGLKAWFQGSVIVITAWQDEDAKLQAFELGADDYISKPFSPRELLARVRVALRRARKPHETNVPQLIQLGNLEIDRKEHRVRVGQSELALTQTEYKFLLTLALEPESLVSQKRLLEEVWGPNHVEDTHYLRILVSRLRKKVNTTDAQVTIMTEAGLGYRLSVRS